MSTRSDSYDVTTTSPARPVAAELGPRGWAVVAGSAIAVAGVAVSFAFDPAVPEEMFSYPYSPNVYRATEVLWALTHGLVAFGVVGLGALVRGRLGRIGSRVAVVGAVLLVPAELGMITLATSREDSTGAAIASTLIGLAATVFAVGLVLVTVAARREQVWTGWGSWLPLVAGLSLFLPVALDGIGPDAFSAGILLTNLAFLVLGLALVGESRR